jgi:hypothetical protein
MELRSLLRKLLKKERMLLADGSGGDRDYLRLAGHPGNSQSRRRQPAGVLAREIGLN